MSGAKNVIDRRPSKGFSPSQGNEHLRRLDDCERAQKMCIRDSHQGWEGCQPYTQISSQRCDKQGLVRGK